MMFVCCRSSATSEANGVSLPCAHALPARQRTRVVLAILRETVTSKRRYPRTERRLRDQVIFVTSSPPRSRSTVNGRGIEGWLLVGGELPVAPQKTPDRTRHCHDL